MKVLELLTESANKKFNLIDMLEDFLPLAKEELTLDQLPKIKLVGTVTDDEQPTFGRYNSEEQDITLAILNRHPIDILRTLAHELVHYRQDINDELGPHSGETGSPQENQAHELAGVIMRHFNKANPQYLFIDRVELPLSK
jgi:hypothetical protein